MYKDGNDFLEFWGQHLIKDTLIQKGEVWGKFYRNDFFFFLTAYVKTSYHSVKNY